MNTEKYTFSTVVHENEEEPYGLKITINDGPFKGFEVVIFRIDDVDEGDDSSLAIDYYISKTTPEYSRHEIDMDAFERTVEEGVNVFLTQLADKMEKEGFDPEAPENSITN